MPRSGFQSFFSVLTQISPFFATFGWKIFVRKNAFGGVCGKSFPRASLTRKTPPAYGVPAGTKMFKQTLTMKKFYICRLEENISVIQLNCMAELMA